MTPAKRKTALERAGTLIYGFLRRAEQDVHEGRASMHWTRASRLPGSAIWLNDYRYTKLAIQELRAARLLYDKLPKGAR